MQRGLLRIRHPDQCSACSGQPKASEAAQITRHSEPADQAPTHRETYTVGRLTNAIAA